MQRRCADLCAGAQVTRLVSPVSLFIRAVDTLAISRHTAYLSHHRFETMG